MEATVNAEQQTFIINASGGYSCLGFHNCQERIAEMAKRMGLPGPQPEEFGTLHQYQQYLQYVERFRHHISNRQTWYAADTPAEVRRNLEWAISTNRRLRLYYGDKATGQDWLEENDVLGTIGRSTGPMRVPLLIPSKDRGGPAILTASIVRVQDARTYAELYQHPEYEKPALILVPSDKEFATKLPWTSKVRNTEGAWETHARHVSKEKGEVYNQFMCGDAMSLRVYRKAA